jgi:antirestriction protein
MLATHPLTTFEVANQMLKVVARDIMTFITECREPNPRFMTKQISRIGSNYNIQNYDKGYLYNFRDQEVDSIQDVCLALQSVASSPHTCLIKGAGKNSTQNKTRRQLETTIPTSHHWIMIDLDKIDLGKNYTLDQLPQLMVKRYLPEEFQDVSYVWQHSSRAGLFGDNIASAHVFFWLKEKQSDQTLKAWGKAHNKNLNIPDPENPAIYKNIIDLALFNQVQPHFVVDPVFIGIPDPISDRLLFYQGSSDEVDFKYIESPKPVYQVQNQPIKYEPDSDEVHAVVNELKDWYIRPNYRKWIEFVWAIIKVLGKEEGRTFCESTWPPEANDQYDEIIDQYDASRAPSLQSLISEIREFNPEFIPPMYSEALKTRLARLKANAIVKNQVKIYISEQELCDATLAEIDAWRWSCIEFNLEFYCVEAECGAGKTEWALQQIANHPGRYIIAIDSIRLIREMQQRLEEKHGLLQQTLGYHFKTIFSKKGNEDLDDDEFRDEYYSESSVTQQLEAYKLLVDVNSFNHTVVFITHKALFQTDWSDWSGFQLIVDEIPDVYTCYKKNFTQRFDVLENFIEVESEESNYYRMGLTDHAKDRIESSEPLDTIESSLEGLIEGINNPNINIYAQKQSWDCHTEQKIRFLKLVDPHFFQYFTRVTVMGDEFIKSLLALVWERTYGVKFITNPDWNPKRNRSVPLKDRVHLHYFSDGDYKNKDERRASCALYSDSIKRIIEKVKAWVSANISGQKIITTNKPSRHFFPDDENKIDDLVVDGLVTTVLYENEFKWLPPKVRGLDKYKDVRTAVWLAAMRPSYDEVEFLKKSFYIHEEDIIEWREYNPMYQFIMRCALRDYDSESECHIVVWDQHQAEYLARRFNGALSCTKHSIPGLDIKKGTNKGGRPTNQSKGIETKREGVNSDKEKRAEYDKNRKSLISRARDEDEKPKTLRQALTDQGFVSKIKK